MGLPGGEPAHGALRWVVQKPSLILAQKVEALGTMVFALREGFMWLENLRCVFQFFFCNFDFLILFVRSVSLLSFTSSPEQPENRKIADDATNSFSAKEARVKSGRLVPSPKEAQMQNIIASSVDHGPSRLATVRGNNSFKEIQEVSKLSTGMDTDKKTIQYNVGKIKSTKNDKI